MKLGEKRMNIKIKNIVSRAVCAVLCTAAVVMGVCGADVSLYAAKGSGTYQKKAAAGEELWVIPGGMPFGVKLYAEGVSVVEVGEVKGCGTVSTPARDAGMREMDIITEVNGQRVSDAATVSELIASSGGKAIVLTVKRGEQTLSLTLTPVIADDGKYRAGIVIKDSTSGIGTVTYINPEDGSFAGLGHGICEGERGNLAALTRGAVVNVAISGVVKGQSGVPGELRGYFCSGKIGTVLSNTECGVYGVFAENPKGTSETPIEVAAPGEMCEGDAEILCTTDGTGAQRYSVKISSIEHTGKATKNFVVTVTDARLIERTGGIVQGMSGSPILQNGKLVGALTHVLVNEPTKGYGIFIENMLNAAG